MPKHKSRQQKQHLEIEKESVLINKSNEENQP